MSWRNRIVGAGTEKASALVANPHNWRLHPKKQQETLTTVLADVGWVQDVIVNRTTGRLVDGHLRVEMALAAGDQDVPVKYVELTEDEERAVLATLDPVAAMAETDAATLAALVASIEDIGAGLRSVVDDVAGALGVAKDEDNAGADTEPEIDKAEELRQKWGVETGQLWQMGEHRLICGDCTDAEVVERVMGGEKAALVFGDPPYFAKVDEEWDNDFEGYLGFLDFIDRLFALWVPLMLDRGTCGWWCAPDFAWHIEERLRKHAAPINHIVWFKGASLGATVSVEDMRRWRPRSERLLLAEHNHTPDQLLASFNAKTAHIAARSAYEAIIDRLIGWQKTAGLSNKEIDRCLGTNGMAGHYFGRSQWALPTKEAWEKFRPLFAERGVDIGEWETQRREFDAQRREFDAQRDGLSSNFTDVWHIAAPRAGDRVGHPTQKPMEIYEKVIGAHSRQDDLVAEPFSGSGTTIIACENLKRRCRAVEISPGYVAVALERWHQHTGKMPELIEG